MTPVLTSSLLLSNMAHKSIITIVDIWNFHLHKLIENHVNSVTSQHCLFIFDELFEKTTVRLDLRPLHFDIIVSIQQSESFILHQICQTNADGSAYSRHTVNQGSTPRVGHLKKSVGIIGLAFKQNTYLNRNGSEILGLTHFFNISQWERLFLNMKLN